MARFSVKPYKPYFSDGFVPVPVRLLDETDGMARADRKKIIDIYLLYALEAITKNRETVTVPFSRLNKYAGIITSRTNAIIKWLVQNKYIEETGTRGLHGERYYKLITDERPERGRREK